MSFGFLVELKSRLKTQFYIFTVDCVTVLVDRAISIAQPQRSILFRNKFLANQQKLNINWTSVILNNTIYSYKILVFNTPTWVFSMNYVL